MRDRNVPNDSAKPCKSDSGQSMHDKAKRSAVRRPMPGRREKYAVKRCNAGGYAAIFASRTFCFVY